MLVNHWGDRAAHQWDERWFKQWHVHKGEYAPCASDGCNEQVDGEAWPLWLQGEALTERAGTGTLQEMPSKK